MACRFKRRNCPCDQGLWTRQTVVARFAFMMGRAFDPGSEYLKIEGLFAASNEVAGPGG